MQLPGQSGKLDAVHFGHGNIGDDQGESLTFLSEFCQTLDAVDPEDDLIACSLENGSCNFSQRLLILNIKNGGCVWQCRGFCRLCGRFRDHRIC